MANRSQVHNYYTNPAFSQQSEFYNGKPLSQRIIRQSPVGAQATYHEKSGSSESYDEQEFYEEMLVDDNTGIVKEKKVLVVSSSPGNNLEGPSGNNSKSRYEYIQMQEQIGTNNRFMVCQKQSPNRNLNNVQQVHRYAVIETTNNDFQDLSPTRRTINSNNNHRYEYIPDDYSPSKQQVINLHNQNARYEYIQCDQTKTSPSRRLHRQQQQSQGNPIATQKLHELLSTPKKAPVQRQIILSPQSQRRRMPSSTSSPTCRDPFLTPTKKSSRAQQKLNYALGSRSQMDDKSRHNTAIVAPICSSPIQGVYSETTFSHHKTESWVNLRPKKPAQLTLAIAAFMMMLCGGVTSGLCFYMVSIMGRLYFLDFGIIAGFTCLVLGLLGFRTRNCYWLPNRNYISGYILLSVFSLLMCAGLLILLVLHPKPGTPLADMTSGAVCGISVLSLVLASVGVMTSYCCQYPPPDNRVQHSVPGFTV